ncbi:WD repeat-containing protein 73 [Holothuria leucospilota]|uniref:WD repeat-containing protein 73 n=1 Tax=Holothuria leucospilota TaxID=206669 RepID=A0A9Q1BPX2_HOLLE|nr:WD repeat-containing protein 73 [Holothuria leucospilota]
MKTVFCEVSLYPFITMQQDKLWIEELEAYRCPLIMGLIKCTRLLVTSSPSDTDKIILWDIKEDEDVITQLKTHQGWDNCVRIYDISSFEKEGCSSKLSEPIFVHDGHTSGSEVVLTTHIWHEQCPHTVLSAGNDGSMHAWDWIVT